MQGHEGDRRAFADAQNYRRAIEIHRHARNVGHALTRTHFLGDASLKEIVAELRTAIGRVRTERDQAQRVWQGEMAQREVLVRQLMTQSARSVAPEALRAKLQAQESQLTDSKEVRARRRVIEQLVPNQSHF